MTTPKHKYEFVVEKDNDGYHAYCPGLKGIHVYGKNETEALENAKDAVIAYLDSLQKHGEPLPVESDFGV